MSEFESDKQGSSSLEEECISPKDEPIEHQLLVVRHGERLDEVDSDRWMSEVRQLHISGEDRRPPHVICDDPPLTEDGIQQADKAAISLSALLSRSEEFSTEINCVYTSKLQRSITTAYRIALHLGLPLVLSSGLAMTAMAVQAYRGTFEFISVEKASVLCAGVTVMDGDDPSCPFFLPRDNWFAPLHHLAVRTKAALVVAHRETLYQLAPKDIRTKVPYCCIGHFRFIGSSEAFLSSPSPSLHLSDFKPDNLFSFRRLYSNEAAVLIDNMSARNQTIRARYNIDSSQLSCKLDF